MSRVLVRLASKYEFSPYACPQAVTLRRQGVDKQSQHVDIASQRVDTASQRVDKTSQAGQFQRESPQIRRFVYSEDARATQRLRGFMF